MARSRRRSLSHLLAEVERLPQLDFWHVWCHLMERPPGGRPGETFATLPNGLNHSLIVALARRCAGLLPVPVLAQPRQLLVALWAQDNPTALVTPKWAPGVCIRGDTAD